MTTEIAGLVETLNRYVDSINGRNDLRCGLLMCAGAMEEAAQALTALSARVETLEACLKEGLERERDEWKAVAKGEAHNRIAHQARADALSAELEGLKKGSSSSRDHAQAFGSALELAAKICEQQAEDFLSPEYAAGQPLSSFNERFACGECARAIRAEAWIAAASAKLGECDSSRDTKNHPSTNGEG